MRRSKRSGIGPRLRVQNKTIKRTRDTRTRDKTYTGGIAQFDSNKLDDYTIPELYLYHCQSSDETTKKNLDEILKIRYSSKEEVFKERLRINDRFKKISDEIKKDAIIAVTKSMTNYNIEEKLVAITLKIQELIDRIVKLEQEVSKHNSDMYAHENLKRLD